MSTELSRALRMAWLVSTSDEDFESRQLEILLSVVSITAKPARPVSKKTKRRSPFQPYKRTIAKTRRA